MLDIVGTADPRLAVQPAQIREWIAFDGCTDAMPMETYRQGQGVCRTYTQCRAGTNVTFCTVNGVDHTWPNVTGFSTNDRVWEFLQRYSL